MKRRTDNKRGFMNIFFIGAVMIVLFSFLAFTKEASDMKFRRRELEIMLQFDYRVEAYYLLLEAGQLAMEEEKGYGSFNEYEIIERFEEDRYIEIRDEGERIVISGSLSGVERGYYEIRK